ncbi:MAG: cupin domain-containing protein [Methylophilaceae bacterium]
MPASENTKKQEYLFAAEGCYITELSNTSADPAVSIAKARVEPNVTTAWHQLKDVTERYCILEGTGIVEIGSEPPKNISVGDVVIIPPMTRQRISNIGKTDLIFLAICNPRFTPECYESII